MMITSWDIYWITRLDAVGRFCDFVVLISFFSMLAYSIVSIIYATCIERCPEWFKVKILVWLALAMIVFRGIGVPLPSTKEGVVIYVLPRIANNETVQEIPSNAAEFINEQLKAWVDDLKEKK